VLQDGDISKLDHGGPDFADDGCAWMEGPRGFWATPTIGGMAWHARRGWHNSCGSRHAARGWKGGAVVGVAGAGVWRRIWRGGLRPRMERRRIAGGCGWRNRGGRALRAQGVWRRIWRGGLAADGKAADCEGCAWRNRGVLAAGRTDPVWTPTLRTYRVVEISRAPSVCYITDEGSTDPFKDCP
jgi:hypothetical protein